MKVHTNVNNYLYTIFKRFFDIVISIIALIITLPITIVTAAAIFLEDRGPIFYTQNRMGKNGKLFRIYKFRSMCLDADKKKKFLKNQNEIYGPMFKMSEDPRVTKVGTFIRKHSIDELPQLVNVLIGNMTIVGPRPPLPEEVEKYTEYDMKRLEVKPGCTGLWQVNGRNSLDFQEMVELDIKYIKLASIRLDLKICVKTIWIMICPNEAY